MRAVSLRPAAWCWRWFRLCSAAHLCDRICRAARCHRGAAMAGAGGGIFTGGEPLSDQGRLTAGDFSEIFQAALAIVLPLVECRPRVSGLVGRIAGGLARAGVVFAWMERRAAVLVVVFAAAILRAGSLDRARNRFGTRAGADADCANPAAVDLRRRYRGRCAPGRSFHQRRRTKPRSADAAVGCVTVCGPPCRECWLRLGLLEAAALLTVLLVWRTARSQAAKLTYLAVVLISAGSMIASDLLADRGASDGRARCCSPALHQAGRGAAVLLAAQHSPTNFPRSCLASLSPLWTWPHSASFSCCAGFTVRDHAAAAAGLRCRGTSLVAALLMLTQRSLKRLLVLSTAEDVGFLLLGAASMSVIGTEGALIAAATHALAKALLFICLAGPESAGELETEPVALAARYPVSAFGFLFGMLAMLGVPPTLGFIGRWRLYSTALHLGPVPLSLFILSSIFALIAYALALSRNWWGPPPAITRHPRQIPTRPRASHSPSRPPSLSWPFFSSPRASGPARGNSCWGCGHEPLEATHVYRAPPQPLALPYELGQLQRLRH